MGYKYFENKSCEYYPCHNVEKLNCLFCYCPMYNRKDCLGTPKYIKAKDGGVIKDCSECCFPHIAENYDKVIEFLNKASHF